MDGAPPTPDEQVLFLRNIQRLLAEGQFVASYKFALLHALADLCVLKGDDSGDPLELQIHDIAEKFVELYWQQCRPFQASGEDSGIILSQNTGRQAAVISKVIKAQQECGGSLFRLRQKAPDLWQSLTGDIRQVVSVMPLWKLQTVGSERLEFLYENVGRGKVPPSALLKPSMINTSRMLWSADLPVSRQLHAGSLPPRESGYIQPILQHLGRVFREDFQIRFEGVQALCLFRVLLLLVGNVVASLDGSKLQKDTLVWFDVLRGYQSVVIGEVSDLGLRVHFPQRPANPVLDHQCLFGRRQFPALRALAPRLPIVAPIEIAAIIRHHSQAPVPLPSPQALVARSYDPSFL